MYISPISAVGPGAGGVYRAYLDRVGGISNVHQTGGVAQTVPASQPSPVEAAQSAYPTKLEGLSMENYTRLYQEFSALVLDVAPGRTTIYALSGSSYSESVTRYQEIQDMVSPET